MSRQKFDNVGGLAVLGEMVRLIAPPAGRGEICDQGLALTVKALGPSRALLLVRPREGEGSSVAATWGRAAEGSLRDLGDRALRAGEALEEEAGKGCSPGRVTVLLPGDTGAVGVIVMEAPAHWDAAARIFSRSAARAIAAALRSMAVIQETRAQGELLAQRNVELETLRDLGELLRDGEGKWESDEAILQQTLELLLHKLGLQAGWVLWGEGASGRLQLAAASGVVEEFVARSRREGIGSCLCKDVFETGRLRYARNTTDCPRLPDLVRGSAAMSHACIPLRFERGVMGVMNIVNSVGHTFLPEELQFLETFGRQLCLAVDKIRSTRAESQRNAEARALASLTHAIGGSLDENKVLAAVGAYGRELLAADRCSIFLGDASGPLSLAYLSGPPLEGLEVGQPVDLMALGSQALMGALQNRHPVVVPEAQNDARANAALARRWGVGSVLVVPLIAHERLEGILAVDRAVPSTWSHDEIEVAGALASQAALAIDNARLYREANQAFLDLQQAQYGMMRAERMAAVGTLAASLAHEVRNPLNSINLQLVLLGRRIGRLDPERRAEFGDLLDTARREIARLDGLVEEFLSLSSIDRLSLSETGIDEILREVLALMGPVARERGIELADAMENHMPAVRVDREKIKQVMINLIRNAIEAMPGGGTVRVSSSREDGMAVVRVADTGVGIEPGLDVFDFFMTTKHGGTGLGLPIARRIVEAHGGTLSFDSAPGRGTVFTVVLKTPDRVATRPGAEGR